MKKRGLIISAIIISLSLMMCGSVLAVTETDCINTYGASCAQYSFGTCTTKCLDGGPVGGENAEMNKEEWCNKYYSESAEALACCKTHTLDTVMECFDDKGTGESTGKTTSNEKPTFNTENYHTAEGKAFGQQLYDAYWDCLENTLSKDPEYSYGSSGIPLAKCPQVESLSRAVSDALSKCQLACTYESDYTACVESDCAIDLDKNRGCSSNYDVPNDPCPYYASQTNFHQWQQAQAEASKASAPIENEKVAEEQQNVITEIRRPTFNNAIKFDSSFEPMELSDTQFIYMNKLDSSNQAEMLSYLQKIVYDKKPETRALLTANIEMSILMKKVGEEIEKRAKEQELSEAIYMMFVVPAMSDEELGRMMLQGVDSYMEDHPISF